MLQHVNEQHYDQIPIIQVLYNLFKIVHLCVYVCACMCLYVCVCVRVYMCACMHVCMVS